MPLPHDSLCRRRRGVRVRVVPLGGRSAVNRGGNEPCAFGPEASRPERIGTGRCATERHCLVSSLSVFSASTDTSTQRGSSLVRSSLRIFGDDTVGSRPMRWVSERSKPNTGLERGDENGRGNSVFRAPPVENDQDHDLSKKPSCLCRSRPKGQLAANGLR